MIDFSTTYCINSVKGNSLKNLAFILLSIIWLAGCDSSDIIPENQKVFIKLYGGNGSDQGYDLLQMDDEGFVLVGSTTSNSAHGKDIYIVRTDKDGKMLWQNNIGRPGDDIGRAIVMGNDNTLYVCGETTQDFLPGLGLRDMYVVNISPEDGSLLNEKVFGDSLSDDYATDIIVTNSNKFLITGTSVYRDTAVFYMVETDATLNPINVRTAGVKDTNNYSAASFLNPMVSDTVNPYFSFGTVLENNNGVTLHKFLSFIFRPKGDPSINPDTYGFDTGDSFCTDVILADDNGYYLSGYFQVGNLRQEMLVKINDRRQEIWKKTYPNEFNKSVGEAGIFQTSDGGFVITSVIQLDDPKNDEISLLRLDAAGEMVWRNTFGSDKNDRGAKVIEMNDGGFAIVGTVGFDINTTSQSKMCLIKVTKDGELIIRE